MLSYNPSYDRAAQNMKVGDLKYKEHYEPYDKEFKGDVLDVEVLLADSQINEFISSKGHTFRREDMTLIVKIKDRYWHRLKIKGASIKEDGSRGDYSVLMHDFFCLALRQNQQALADGSDYTFDDGQTITRYPHLAGLKFKIAIAKTSEFKGYDVNTFAFFDLNGFSAPELETYADKPVALGLFLEQLKKDHDAFTKSLELEKQQYNQLGQPQPTNPPSNSEGFCKEDIPF